MMPTQSFVAITLRYELRIPPLPAPETERENAFRGSVRRDVVVLFMFGNPRAISELQLALYANRFCCVSPPKNYDALNGCYQD